MANGFSLGVLTHIKDVTKTATPQYKVEPYGLLGSLKVAHSPGVIKNDSFNGHFKTVKVKKKQRFLVSQTSTTASCDVTNTNPYLEDTVSVANFRQLAFHVQDETIAAYDEYASAITKGGLAMKPATPLMFEFMDNIQTAASAILSAVDQDLWALAVAAIGVNRRTTVATQSTINLPLSNTTQVLTDGPTLIMQDFKLNTMSGKPIMVGSGLSHAWMLDQFAKGAPNQAGIDSRLQTAAFDYWYDQYSGTAMGNANEVIVYEKDAIQLVEYLQYQGFKAGPKPGASIFGTLVLPMQSGDQLIPVEFDYQLRYNDCATTITVDGSSATLQKGYNLILSKTFGLYTIGTNAYRAGDPLAGNRGSLRYRFTNA